MLHWLPEPGADFRSRCKELVSGLDDDPAAKLRQLGTHCLNINQLSNLGKTLLEVRERLGGRLPGMTRFKLGIVSNATTSLLLPCIEASGLRYGLDLEVVAGEFGQIEQEILDPTSLVRSAGLDAALLALDHRAFEFGSGPGSSEIAFARIEDLVRVLRDDARLETLVQTISPAFTTTFGHLDRASPHAAAFQIEDFNARLAQWAGEGNTTVFDVAKLAASVGANTWCDATIWHLGKLAFAQSCVPLYADHVARVISAMCGKSRKVLALDLDNTLWGGVVGDDGLEGIVLEQGDATGEAFRAVQQTALDLRKRGIVLAVCSKNEEAIARSPFQHHPDMILKEDHIAVFVANWADKASNLEMIARHLDVGLDSLVLLDDSPVERAQVRQALPTVAVPEITDNPANYVRALTDSGYFETVGLTEEDMKRADQYQSNAQRSLVESTSRDLNTFIASLEMELSFSSFDRIGHKRIVQLINKTNQFNLTTRRHTSLEVEELRDDPATFTLQVRARDKFGDYGVISVVICRKEQATVWTIETWLMSCRVLKRLVEQATMDYVVAGALAENVSMIKGRYSPTDRNALVKDFYPSLGFAESGMSGEDSLYELNLSITPYVPKNPPIAINPNPR